MISPFCTPSHMTYSFSLISQDVILTNACSGAVNMCIEVLCEPGQNILIPSPGFGLYKCLCEARGVEVRLYRLMVSLFFWSSVVLVVWHSYLVSCCQLVLNLAKNSFSLPTIIMGASTPPLTFSLSLSLSPSPSLLHLLPSTVTHN